MQTASWSTHDGFKRSIDRVV